MSQAARSPKYRVRHVGLCRFAPPRRVPVICRRNILPHPLALGALFSGPAFARHSLRRASPAITIRYPLHCEACATPGANAAVMI
ncbi:hypothetical protein KCP73_12370 [Salmonella enterica subsp. enterica]|nr:hypothetical protein KCP73_12370 [Salmonella enterica subsp. enterica]